MYADGSVFPSAAFAGHPALKMGSVRNGGLEEAWRASPVGAALRSASLVDKERCSTCDVRYLCGGGDVEHTYFHGARTPGREAFLGADPYCDAHFALVLDALEDLARESAAASGVSLPSPRPVILRAMGDGAAPCAQGMPYAVLPTRSACVLPDSRRAP